MQSTLKGMGRMQGLLHVYAMLWRHSATSDERANLLKSHHIHVW